MKRSVITGTGSFLPPKIRRNEDFLHQEFYSEDGQLLTTPTKTVIDNFRKITGIIERRYADDEQNTSDIAAIAGAKAIESSSINPETLDLIIVAHVFGDVSSKSRQTDILPSLACRVKHILGIQNAHCIAYDVLFGCPGWIMAVMQADAFFKAGMAKRALVIGAETLSRVIDRYDRDSMIFSDGAGAVVMELMEAGNSGLLYSSAVSHCANDLNYLRMGPSFKMNGNRSEMFMKMKGPKVYEYVLKHVPQAMKFCLNGCGANVTDLKKIFLHQANSKMNEAIVRSFYDLYNVKQPIGIMPMCVHNLGNSSVATIPTLLDLVTNRECNQDHKIYSGDLVMFASVGAGMNINAACYRVV